MSDSLHLIDADCQLQELGNIVTFLKQTTSTPQLESIGCDYHVISVFGGQSTGKSTLLNYLFGTQFATMDAMCGRKQTTHGCFISVSKTKDDSLNVNRSPLFILDMEGTDGLERAEQQRTEKQLALFALSVADMLMINIWAAEVGRFNAANLALLQTVFEVNLQLLGTPTEFVAERSPQTLLFVLPDHVSGTLELSKQVMLDALETIWSGITMPEAFASIKLTDLFRFEFVALSHYVLQRDIFDEQVDILRTTILSGSLIPPQSLRQIPLDGLPSYMSSCWQFISEHRDLDIPSQRDMLAELRCSEIADKLLHQFTREKQLHADKLRRGAMSLQPQLGCLLESEIDAVLAQFMEQAKLYSSSAVSRFRVYLKDELLAASLPLLDLHCDKMLSEILGAVSASSSREMHKILYDTLPKAAAQWVRHAGQTLTTISTVSEPLQKVWICLSELLERNLSEIQTRLSAPMASKEGLSAIPSSSQLVESQSNTDDERQRGLVSPVPLTSASTSAAQTVSALRQNEARLVPCTSLYGTMTDSLWEHIRSILHDDLRAYQRVMELITVKSRQSLSAQFEIAMGGDSAGRIKSFFDHLLNSNPDGTPRDIRSVSSLQKEIVNARAASLLLLSVAAVMRVNIRPVSKKSDRRDRRENVSFDVHHRLTSLLRSQHLLDFPPPHPTNTSFMLGEPRLVTLEQGGTVPVEDALANAAAELPVELDGKDLDLLEAKLFECDVNDMANTTVSTKVENQALNLSESRLSTEHQSHEAERQSPIEQPSLSTTSMNLFRRFVVERRSAEQFQQRIQLSLLQISRIYELFEQHCEFSLLLRKRQIEQARQPLPGYIYLLLLVLGANEMWMLLRNPLLLIAVVLVAYIFFAPAITAHFEDLYGRLPIWLVKLLGESIRRTRNAFGMFEATAYGDDHDTTITESHVD